MIANRLTSLLGMAAMMESMTLSPPVYRGSTGHSKSPMNKKQMKARAKAKRARRAR